MSSAESNQFIISAGPSGEYLPIPGLTTKQCVPSNISLRTPPVKHAAGTQAAIELNIPFVSAIMQSVSGPGLAIGLARNEGLPFISGSQPITGQAEMVWKVKKMKAGFVASDSESAAEHTLEDVLRLFCLPPLFLAFGMIDIFYITSFRYSIIG